MRPWGRLIAASWLVLALICGAAPAGAENEALSGLLQYDQYNGVVSNGSGGFIVVGAQNTERPPQSVAKLRVFDAAGSLLFDRAIRPRDAVSAALADVVRLADGDIVATGWIQRTGATSDSCWVIRAAPDGSVRWSTTTTGPAHERCYFVTALADGTVLVGGRSEGDTSGNAATVGAYWRVNAGTGALGDPTRVACDQPATRCAFQDGLALADGSLALVGWLTDPARGDDDIWVIRRDRAGQDTVRRRIGGPGADLANAVQARSDGGIFVIGYATGVNDATSGVVFALNEGGSTVWTRQVRVGSAGNDKLLGGVLLPNETLVAAGAASNDAAAPFNGWLVYFGAKGETIRERVFDWPPGGRFTAIATSNGDLAAVGAARAADGSDTDGWLARLDPLVPTADDAPAGAGKTNALVADAQVGAGDATTAVAAARSPACGTEYHTVEAGEQACGFSFNNENRLLLDGKSITGPHLRDQADRRTITIFPASPSGRYTAVDFIGSFYIVDRETAKIASHGPGGSNETVIRWISWSADETRALLVTRDSGPQGGDAPKWLHTVDLSGDRYRPQRFPYDSSMVFPPDLARPDAVDSVFTWLDSRRFRIHMAKCAGSPSCDQTTFDEDWTSVEFALTDDGLHVVAIEDPNRVSAAVRRAFRNRQAVEAAVAEGKGCEVLFHEFSRGGEACGIGLDANLNMTSEGARISVSGRAPYDTTVSDFKLVIFPASPSGRYTVVLACSTECGGMYLLDRDRRTVIPFDASKYGPHRWIAWYEDLGQLLLLNYADGVSWFQTVRLTDATVKVSPFYFLVAPPYSSFERVTSRQFQLEVACRGTDCFQARYPQDLTSVRFEVTGDGVRTVAVLDPAKISLDKSLTRNSL